MSNMKDRLKGIGVGIAISAPLGLGIGAGMDALDGHSDTATAWEKEWEVPKTYDQYLENNLVDEEYREEEYYDSVLYIEKYTDTVDGIGDACLELMRVYVDGETARVEDFTDMEVVELLVQEPDAPCGESQTMILENFNVLQAFSREQKVYETYDINEIVQEQERIKNEIAEENRLRQLDDDFSGLRWGALWGGVAGASWGVFLGYPLWRKVRKTFTYKPLF